MAQVKKDREKQTANSGNRKRIKDNYISKHLSVLLDCLFFKFEQLRGLNY